ncbi:putative membrane protein [Bordetella bronchiseptica 1289]|uniref:DMT family transporter n=1 Tax=Bordetella bronchiseptica TaxID=518 RepID=UPI00029034A4|nr:DMT family transporter [Bordetella bronchiseptica]CCN23996.1 putative membrane protein [Bordetella bronchiseptica 1289]
MAPAPAPAATRQRRLGIALFFGALVAFATFDAACKYMLQFYPAPFLNVMRYTAVATIAAFMLLRHGLPRLSATPRRGLLVVRGLMLGTVGTCFMTALIWMPLSEATAIYFTSPMIMVALSPWLLGESVGRAQWLAVAVGFGGMLLIVRPGADLPALGTVLMAVAAVSYAIFQLLTRKLAGQVPGHVQYAYTAFICLLMTALPAPFFLPQPWPGLADSLVIIALGLCNGLAQILLIGAFQRVEASTLAPLNYCHLLMAVAFSTFWFGMPPDAPATAGMALIVAAGIFLVTRRAPGTPRLPVRDKESAA